MKLMLIIGLILSGFIILATKLIDLCDSTKTKIIGASIIILMLIIGSGIGINIIQNYYNA